jgi:hypothetical protein
MRTCQNGHIPALLLLIRRGADCTKVLQHQRPARWKMLSLQDRTCQLSLLPGPTATARCGCSVLTNPAGRRPTTKGTRRSTGQCTMGTTPPRACSSQRATFARRQAPFRAPAMVSGGHAFACLARSCGRARCCGNHAEPGGSRVLLTRPSFAPSDHLQDD